MFITKRLAILFFEEHALISEMKRYSRVTSSNTTTAGIIIFGEIIQLPFYFSMSSK